MAVYFTAVITYGTRPAALCLRPHTAISHFYSCDIAHIHALLYMHNGINRILNNELYYKNVFLFIFLFYVFH